MALTATVNITGAIATSITVSGLFSSGPNNPEITVYFYRNGSYVYAWNSTLLPELYEDSSFSFDVAYYYELYWSGSYYPASNTVTPKSLEAPTINSVIGAGATINSTWTNEGSPYTSIEIRARESGGTWGTQATLAGSATSYAWSMPSYNQKYGIAIQGNLTDYGAATSGELEAANWAVTVTDTLTLTDSVPGAGILTSVTVADILTLTDTITATATAAVTVSDVLTLTDVVTAATIFNLTVTDTLTLTDSVSAAQTLRTNYSYYLGDVTGAVYAYDSQYLSDAGTAISAFWNSKRIDFADQHPDVIDKWKTIYKIPVHYEDLSASTLIVLHVSTDGGANWTTSGKSVGTGAGTIKEKDFFFIKTGRMFNFKVESSNTAKSFKIIGLKAEFDVGGEYFEV